MPQFPTKSQVVLSPDIMASACFTLGDSCWAPFLPLTALCPLRKSLREPPPGWLNLGSQALTRWPRAPQPAHRPTEPEPCLLGFTLAQKGRGVCIGTREAGELC